MSLRRHLFWALSALGLLAIAPAARAEATTWTWPLQPPHVVLNGFAPPAHDWLPGHRGVDLAARVGESVLAAGAGRVSFAGRIGAVDVVAVRHPGGLETTYEPVRAVVRVGAAVVAGQRLGVVSSRLAHCAPRPCLHWGLLRGGVYQDPLGLVGAGNVRLLPMLRQRGDGAWVVPAVSGASVGSSAVAAGWAVAVHRRRRRRLPAGVACLDELRAAKAAEVSRDRR